MAFDRKVFLHIKLFSVNEEEVLLFLQFYIFTTANCRTMS